MTPYDSISETFREALAAHDIISTFGVSVDDIYVALDDGKLLVVARTTTKQCVVDVGLVDLNEDDFRMEWGRAVKIYNESSVEDRTRLLENSRAREQAVKIISGLVSAGFETKRALS